MFARRRSLSKTLAVVSVASLVLAGCSGGDSGTTLTVATFGEFGYEPLFAEYEKDHPGIEIESRVTDFDTHHKGLTTQLAAGHGAADVVAVEEQYVPQFLQSKDKFVNLADYGATKLERRWAPWKWAQGVTDGGNFVFGLGTDMGSLAMCYRKDYFQRANLPTDRDAVAKLWPTWEEFARTGDRFSGAVPDVKFTDSAGTVYTAMLNQTRENYFSAADDSFIGDTNPSVRHAFDLSGGIAARGQTAGVTTYTQEWNVAIKQGSFATIACPAWMLALIREAGGPENADRWDVAEIPGEGGSQGGSFLTVPVQSEHRKDAYELARWLTAPEQEKRLFLDAGILPSEPEVYRDPDVVGKTDPYFSDAPVGQLFAKAADELRPNYRGLRDADVRPEFGMALGRVEDGKQTVDEAWGQAVANARDVLSK